MPIASSIKTLRIKPDLAEAVKGATLLACEPPA